MQRFGPTVVLVTAWSLAACGSLRTHQDSVRMQLEREYGAIVDGFSRDDPSEWIRRLAPDFRLVLFNGSVQNRDWVVQYVTNNAKAFHVVELHMRLKGLSVAANSAVATVEQTSRRTFADSTGRQHIVEVGAVQLEAWRRHKEGWRLEKVQEKELLYLRRDGK